MSDSAKERSEVREAMFFEPADAYDGYYAFLHTGSPSLHVVDTTTFDNSIPVPENYEGHGASKGSADTLCGRNLFGHMIPLGREGRNTSISGICSTCLRSLRTQEVSADEQ